MKDSERQNDKLVYSWDLKKLKELAQKVYFDEKKCREERCHEEQCQL